MKETNISIKAIETEKKEEKMIGVTEIKTNHKVNHQNRREI